MCAWPFLPVLAMEEEEGEEARDREDIKEWDEEWGLGGWGAAFGGAQRDEMMGQLVRTDQLL